MIEFIKDKNFNYHNLVITIEDMDPESYTLLLRCLVEAIAPLSDKEVFDWDLWVLVKLISAMTPDHSQIKLCKDS